MERGERIAQEFLNLAYQDGQPIELENIDRWKSNLIGNIYGAINKFKNTQLIGEELNELIEKFCNSDRGYNFNTDLLNEKTIDNINTIIEKHEKEPFLRWNYNLKTKLRYNFHEDSKRTWNKFKMTATLSSEIKPEQFANHYGENWSNSPPKMNVEKYNEFTKHNKREKLKLTRFEVEILNEETIKRCIISKDNLSAPGLDG
jgi:hypothetical protein